MAVPPFLYGLSQFVYLLACLGGLPPDWADLIHLAGLPLKWATVIFIPVLLYRLGMAAHRQQIPGIDEPLSTVGAISRRWWLVTGFWLGLGVATVLAFFPFAGEIAEASAKPASTRLWPGTDSIADRPSLEVASDPAYNVSHILTTELAAVILIAVASGLCLRLCRRLPESFALALPPVVLMSLTVYSALAPGAWIWDYDPFVGDIVLGGVLAELVLFFGPNDPVGATAIGIAALSVTTLTWVFNRIDRTAPVLLEPNSGTR